MPSLISADAQAIVLVCAQLTPSAAGANRVSPYAATEWAKLANLLHSSLRKTPSFLLDQSAAALRAALGVPAAEAERLYRLLARGAHLAVELERLASLGIWVLTKADEDYPARFRALLRHKAPPVLFGAESISAAAAPAAPAAAVPAPPGQVEAQQLSLPLTGS